MILVELYIFIITNEVAYTIVTCSLIICFLQQELILIIILQVNSLTTVRYNTT